MATSIEKIVERLAREVQSLRHLKSNDLWDLDYDKCLVHRLDPEPLTCGYLYHFVANLEGSDYEHLYSASMQMSADMQRKFVPIFHRCGKDPILRQMAACLLEALTHVVSPQPVAA